MLDCVVVVLMLLLIYSKVVSAEKQLLRQVLQRIQKMALARAYTRWKEQVEEGQRMAQTCARVIGRMQQGAVSGAFEAWWEFRCVAYMSCSCSTGRSTLDLESIVLYRPDMLTDSLPALLCSRFAYCCVLVPLALISLLCSLSTCTCL